MSVYLNKLQLTGDFLTLTRDNENHLPAFSFIVTSKSNQQKTSVSVLDTGIICFEPIDQTTDKDIVLSSAIHGNETAPIEICASLIQRIILGELAVKQRVLFLIGNPPAINIGERFVEENLNRLFSGEHANPEVPSNKERVRAKQLEQTVANFFNDGAKLSENRSRYHYDLHTAIRPSKNDKFAVYPFRHNKPWDKDQLSFLLACGINTILLSHSPTTTFSYYSSNEHNAHAFTVELGKVMPFGQNDMANFADVSKLLTELITGEKLSVKVYNESDFNIFEIYQTINRTQQSFTLNFADDAPNFTSFPIGYIVATDGETAYTIEHKGESIIFPNANVAIGQRALLTVIPTKI